MKKHKRRLTALFVVLAMLLNVGGVYGDTSIQETDSIIELELSDTNAQEDLEEESVQEEKQEEVVEEAVQEEKQEEIAEEVVKEEKQEEIAEEVVQEEKQEEKLVEEGPVILDAEVDGVIITVSAEAGVLPQDTSLSVSPISDEDSRDYAQKIVESIRISLSEFIAFDITLLDNEGMQVQPNGQVDVTFSGIEFIKDTDEIMVYHLEPREENEEDFNLLSRRAVFNNTEEDLIVNEIMAQSSHDEVSFSTDHFSIYGVGVQATASYEFYVGESLQDTQIVLNNEKLEEPEAPSKQEGKKFIGWYVEGESNPINFDDPVAVDSGPSGTYKVEARFEDVLYVYFIYNDNVIATKEVQPNEVTDDSAVPLVITEAGKALSHWSIEENGGAFDFDTGITEDTTLYAVLADRWKVTFDTQGGNTLLPKYTVNGEPLGAVDVPVRAGYSFQQWNTKADGTGDNYTNNTAINSDIKLYAIWKAETVNYSIIYWLENADDNLYTYKETAIAQGVAGTTIALAINQRQNGRYDYFSYKEHDTGRTINGNGTTVVNVYYSRNSYKVVFDLNRSNSKLKIGGKTYTGSGYSFTAKYESDISNLWPTAMNIDDVGKYQFYGWTSESSSSTLVSKRLKLTSDLISTGGTKTFTGSWRDDLSLYTLHYMIESLTNSGEKLYNGKYYNEDMAYRQTANSTGNWSAKQLPGVKNIGKESESKRHEYFYYDRLSYDLNFYNPTLLDTKHTLKYGASIQDKNYTPDKPVGMNEDYVFMGWYKNSAGQGNAFDFTNATMPENNLALYSKWAPPVYSVKYYETQDADGGVKSVDNIPGGEKIFENQLTKAIPEGLELADFRGWYWYLDTVFVPYDFSTPIYRNDIVLYPVWDDLNYTVTYEANGGSGTVPEDNNKYFKGSAASILGPTELQAPTGKIFVGWKKDSSGTIYYPNDKLTITGNMSLSAQWGDIVKDTELTYLGNGGTGTGDVVQLKNNATHEVLGNMFSLEGYKFMGWNTKSDGSGDGFQPADTIIVGNSDPVPNELYAQWTKKIIVTAADDTKEYDAVALAKNVATASGLLPGHTMSEVIVVGSQSVVGNSPNKASAAKIVDGSNNDVTAKYEIEYVDGTLTVTQRSMTVTANSGTVEYDGTLQTVTGYTITSGLLAGHVISGLTASGYGINVGDHPVTFTGTPVIMDGLVDVSENYAVTLLNGNLKITPGKMELVVTANSEMKVYNGLEQTVTGYEITSGLVAGHVLSGLSASGSGTNVGSYDVTFTGTPVIMDGEVDVTGNYDVRLVPGKLEIAKAEIELIVTANSGTVEYDGTLQTVTGYTVTSGLLAGHVISGLTASGYGINVGDHPVTFTGTPVIMDGLVDVSENYAVTLLDGNLKITPGKMELVVTANSETKVYNGLEQTVTGYEITSGLVAGHVLSGLSASGSGTNVGSYDVTFIGAPVIMDGEVDVTQNYDVRLVDGNLSIWKSELTVEKSADKETFSAVGEEITYTYVIKNTGSVALSGPFTLVDDKIGSIDTGSVETLAPGESFLVTAVYAVTQSDMETGFVTNVVKATGVFGEEEVTGEDEVTVPVSIEPEIQEPSLSVEKSADKATFSAVGEKITYSYKVTNTGNVTLSGPFTLVDDKIGSIDTGSVETLPPGESFVVTAVYVVTESDMEAGFVTNIVKATGVFGEEEVPGEDKVTVPVSVEPEPETQKPSLSVEKSADKATFSAVGEKITYSYKVTNTGNVTLSGPFSLVDDKIGLVDTGSVEKLAPGESFLVTAVYVVTRADVNARFITNLVEVTGTFEEESVLGEDELTIRVRRTPTDEDEPEDNLVEVDDDEVPLGIPTDKDEPGDDLIEIDDDEIPLGLPIEDTLNMVDHFKYIMGYPNNTVQPEGLITREEVATVFFRLLTPEYRDSITTTSHSFPDIKAGKWSEKPIATLVRGNMIVGYEDGTFRPGRNITRAELAAIASRFDNLSPFTSNKFTDIEGHWANQSINSAAEKGWVNGYEDGTFRPNEFITRAEFVTLVNNVLNRKVRKVNISPDARQFPDLSESKWYYEAMQEAINSHHYTREEDGIYEIWTDLY